MNEIQEETETAKGYIYIMTNTWRPLYEHFCILYISRPDLKNKQSDDP